MINLACGVIRISNNVLALRYSINKVIESYSPCIDSLSYHFGSDSNYLVREPTHDEHSVRPKDVSRTNPSFVSRPAWSPVAANQAPKPTYNARPNQAQNQRPQSTHNRNNPRERPELHASTRFTTHSHVFIPIVTCVMHADVDSFGSVGSTRLDSTPWLLGLGSSVYK